MKKVEAIIFDLDGTLYSFDSGAESQFSSSEFGRQFHSNCVQFFKETCSVDTATAEAIFLDFVTRYDGEVSWAVEQELGIDRAVYFDFTWNIQAERFIKRNLELVQLLQELPVRSAVLTAAPRVWAEKALQFLQIQELFGQAVFTGDPDIRKPNPLAFKQVAEFLKLDPGKIVSIGDQEKTDILPARSLGMKTVRIARQAETVADFRADDVIAAIALLKQEGVI